MYVATRKNVYGKNVFGKQKRRTNMQGVGVGTNVYSVLFIAVAVIAAVALAAYLFKVWNRYVKDFQKASDEDKEVFSWTSPVIKTVLVVAVFVVLVTLGWNLKQSVTTSTTDYKSPAEVAEQKRVLEAKPPTSEEMDKARSDLKGRAEVQPHERALESFDAKMKQEAEKIKRRSLDTVGAEEKNGK